MLIKLKIIFCFLCVLFSPHSLHGHSRITNSHDKHNIDAENTNSHVSVLSEISVVCDNSGINKPIKDKTMGKTQQNKCGNNDAIIPILIALFFICFSFVCFFTFIIFARNNENRWRSQQNSNLHLILRRDLFYPVELWEHVKTFYTHKKINQYLVIAI